MGKSETPKRLRISTIDIVDALARSDDDQTRPCLDRESGEVIIVVNDLLGVEEDEIAAAIDADPDRYEWIPAIPTRDQYQWMAEFAESVDEDDIRGQLELALGGKGAFARFRDVVSGYPDLKDAWWSFRQDAILRKAVDWLNGIGIEPTFEMPVVVNEPAPARHAAKPRVALVHLLLLGGGARPNEIVEGRVTRRVRATSEGEARSFFKSLAREIAEAHGLAWRKRFIEGKSAFTCEEMELRVEGAVIELRVAIDAASAARFVDRSTN